MNQTNKDNEGNPKMKETIVTVLFTSPSAKASAKVWQNDAFAIMSGMKKWKPIVADGIFTIVSEIGSFNLSNHNFASVMMCDRKKWKKYCAEFVKIVNSIDSKARIVENEITIER